jgi:HlyD family secretion protein
MDIARPVDRRRQRIRQVALAAVAIVGVLGITLGLSRLKPAAPAVERASVWIDTVRRGPMVREVRGVGTLVPEDIRWIPATTVGRVEEIVLRPGTAVEPGTVILELSNPTLAQELEEATLRLRAAEASQANLKIQLDNDTLQQEATNASIEADYEKAALQADVNRQLAAKQLVSTMVVRQAELDAEQLAARLAIAKKQLASRTESMRSRLAVQQAEVDQARALMALKQRQVDDLHVRAGFAGVLQLVPVDVGQQVAPGTNLARVADPARLKAELRIAETQARDVQIGQKVSIDTRNGLVDGTVSRLDPSVQNGTVTVDVALPAVLPKGARPDLSVDGTVELERLPDVLFVGRPAFGQEQSAVGLFKVQADGEASRVRVTLGRSSVNTVEIVSGLNAGDQVVLSDMSAWDAFDRVRLR